MAVERKGTVLTPVPRASYPSHGMKDDPQEIATYLAKKHGLHGALDAVTKGTAAANESRNLYDLSVWREVKVVELWLNLVFEHLKRSGVSG